MGKTHLAQALAHEACRQGFDVLFADTHKLLQHLQGGRADGAFERRLQNCLCPDLLVLDDFGPKPLQAPAPEDLYDLINQHYERGSILLTSNRADRNSSEIRSWLRRGWIGWPIGLRRCSSPRTATGHKVVGDYNRRCP